MLVKAQQSSSHEVLVSDSLRSHNAFKALSRPSHCGDDGMFKTQWHLKQRCTILVKTSRTTTAFVKPPVWLIGDLTTLLWWPYGYPNAQVLERQAIFILGVPKVSAFAWCSVRSNSIYKRCKCVFALVLRATKFFLHAVWWPWERCSDEIGLNKSGNIPTKTPLAPKSWQKIESPDILIKKSLYFNTI